MQSTPLTLALSLRERGLIFLNAPVNIKKVLNP
jgi:hypothetical protein